MTTEIPEARRRAAGLCTRCGRVMVVRTATCARCRAAERHWHQQRTIHRREAPGPNRIAHCRTWHPLTALPWWCPQCGACVGLCMEDAP